MKPDTEPLPCKHCQKVIPVCECGAWDCGFYAHLRLDCPSEAGARYRERCERVTKTRTEPARQHNDILNVAISVDRVMSPWHMARGDGGHARFSLDSWDQVFVNGVVHDGQSHGFVFLDRENRETVVTPSIEETKAEVDRICREAGWTLLEEWPDGVAPTEEEEA